MVWLAWGSQAGWVLQGVLAVVRPEISMGARSLLTGLDLELSHKF